MLIDVAGEEFALDADANDTREMRFADPSNSSSRAIQGRNRMAPRQWKHGHKRAGSTQARG